MTKTCLHCGSDYFLPKCGQRAGQEASKRFCSKYCAGAYNYRAFDIPKDGKTFTCRVCGATWGRYEKQSRQYCSDNCYKIGMRRKANARERKRIASRTLIFACLHCGKIGPKVGKQKFCSIECRTEYYQDLNYARWWEFGASDPPPTILAGLTCLGCGEDSPPAFSDSFEVRKGSLVSGKEFCSASCYQRWYNELQRFPKGGHEHRARHYGVEYEPIDRDEIFERDGWICQLCGKPVDKNARWPEPHMPSIDHIIPLSLGGPHLRTNIQCAHLTCNMSKGNRTVGEQLLLVG